VSTRTNLQKPNDELASSPAPQNLKFEREDWSLFRTIEGLQQKAGVSKDKLSRLVLKELTDNGYDDGAIVEVGELPKGGYFVDDNGHGIGGTPGRIARLFSINRPMVSTKLLRLPTRGALGNGLRVVAGAVLASGGTLIVITRNRRIVLRPERDGTTTVVSVKPVKRPVGTRVEISFGPALQSDDYALCWAEITQLLALFGSSYAGKSSPWWYDVPQFHELLYATGKRPVRELIAHLDGCSGGKAGEIVTAARLGRALCSDVTQAQAAKLLQIAREQARPVSPQRLGAVGAEAFFGHAYAITSGIRTIDGAKIPYVIEAWAETNYDTDLTVCVNRTPITGEIEAARDKRDIDAYGCGLSHNIAQAPKDVNFDITVNITVPFMPIRSDGKAPDLLPFLDGIKAAIGKAIKKAHRPGADGKVTQKDVVLDNLDDVIANVSGDGQFRFAPRQLLYGLRPIVMNEIGEELKLGNFTKIITDYEAEHGEIEGMYREPRGSIYHPHRGETITLGTITVEDYKRPKWTYNKLVYIEKEGWSEALKEARWAERNDCMLMSSKGFTTRAARDLVDKLAEHDEPVTIFCVHDADASGTMIHQTFQEATKARGARKIQIVNLGLEAWEAIAMGLQVEDVEEKERYKAVADYVLARKDRAPNGKTWEQWLQTHRVELNAMTTPQFIAWLDGKMADYDKLIPPADVLKAELDHRIEEKVRTAITERILREAGYEQQVAETLKVIKRPTAATLAKGIAELFERERDREWRDHIEAVADRASE
jgi:Topoisomerase 6 subunit A/Spo11, Toprim domain